jgi:hypothetical protein
MPIKFSSKPRKSKIYYSKIKNFSNKLESSKTNLISINKSKTTSLKGAHWLKNSSSNSTNASANFKDNPSSRPPDQNSPNPPHVPSTNPSNPPVFHPPNSLPTSNLNNNSINSDFNSLISKIIPCIWKICRKCILRSMKLWAPLWLSIWRILSFLGKKIIGIKRILSRASGKLIWISLS